MAANGAARRTGNVIPEGKEIGYAKSVRSPARPEAVYDVLVDLRTHLEWGGSKSRKKYRLTSIEVADVPAQRGTEWSSTGVAPDGRFADRSVVTEASRPRAFEFVTDAHVTFKRGGEGDWTVVHRYEIVPDGTGSRISLSSRVTRATELGPMKIALMPVLGALGKAMAETQAKTGLQNLSAMAQDRASRR